MSNSDEVIDAEIVENLPAVIETHQHTEPITKWSEEWWERQSDATRASRCRAHKRTGERCKNLAIQGSTVCRFHGGAAKHVRAAARARLENAADRMARELLGIALSADSESVRLQAIRDSLDRAGLRPPTEVVLSPGNSAPYEEIFDDIAGGSREASRAARGYDLQAEDHDAVVEVDEFLDDPPSAATEEVKQQPLQPHRRPTPPAITGMDAIEAAAHLRQIQEGDNMRYSRP
jgi:hypothetical protein